MRWHVTCIEYSGTVEEQEGSKTYSSKKDQGVQVSNVVAMGIVLEATLSAPSGGLLSS